MSAISHAECTVACTAVPDAQPLRCGFCRHDVAKAVPGAPDPHWRRENGNSRCHRRPLKETP